MLLRRLRAAIDLDATGPEPQPVAPSRFALVRRVRSALDLCPATPESRRASARLLPLFGPLVLAATLAPVLGRQAGLATWMILSIQGLAVTGLLGLVVAIVRGRAR